MFEAPSQSWRPEGALLSDLNPGSSWSAICDRYHRWYYDTEVWKRTTYLGIPCLKSVSDMWNYQEILYALKPSLVLEFGTWCGGSSLYFAHLLGRISPGSRVLSVDVSDGPIDPRVRAEKSIELLTCSTTDPAVAKRIEELRSLLPGPVFAILDSDHRKHHVLGELKLLRPLLRRDDYLIVEDSNINGHPVLPGWGEGPFEAISEYEREFPGDYEHDFAREEKFGFSFASRGFLVRR
jgi:cephalosporin hydroxylase